VLLLTTPGRNTDAKRTAPLIYQRHGDDYLHQPNDSGPGQPHGSAGPGPCRKRIPFQDTGPGSRARIQKRVYR
jgi:hypothetical protein